MVEVEWLVADCFVRVDALLEGSYMTAAVLLYMFIVLVIMSGAAGSTLAVVCGFDCPAKPGVRETWGLVAMWGNTGTTLAVVCGLDCPAKSQVMSWRGVAQMAVVSMGVGNVEYAVQWYGNKSMLGR